MNNHKSNEWITLVLSFVVSSLIILRIMGPAFAQAVLTSVLLGQTLAAVHQWPNPVLDELEHQRWDQKVGQSYVSLYFLELTSMSSGRGSTPTA
jgi:hypothetical protein